MVFLGSWLEIYSFTKRKLCCNYISMIQVPHIKRFFRRMSPVFSIYPLMHVQKCPNFKNLVVLTSQDFQSMFGHFLTIMHERVNIFTKYLARNNQYFCDYTAGLYPTTKRTSKLNLRFRFYTNSSSSYTQKT